MLISYASRSGWLATVSMALFMALYFQVAWQYPIVDSLPLIERLLDPEYLLNDFYTNTLMDYSPRRNAVECIVFLSQLLELPPTVIIAWANIFRILLYALALYGIYQQLDANKHVVFIAFYLSALSFLSVPNQPAWWPITYDLTASSIAGTFAIFAWWQVLKQRVPLTLALLCGSVYFHPLVGVHSVLIAIVLFLASFGISAFVKLLIQPLNYVVGIALLAIFLYVYLPYEVAVSDEKFIAINAQFKHAHHFLSLHIDFAKWVGFITGMIFLMYLLNRQHTLKHEDRVSIVIVLYSFFMIFINVVFVDLAPNRTMISFIPLRAYPILLPIFIICFARYAFYKYKKEDYCSFFLLHLPFLPYESVGLTWFIFPNQHTLTLPIVIFVIACSLALMAEKFPLFDAVNQWLTPYLSRINLQSIILPFAISALAFSIFRFEINIPTLDNQAAIYRWIKSNTKDSDIILSELHAANNQKIRLVSSRAVIVSKDFPFSEKHYEEWYQRYTTVYEHQKVSRGRIDKYSAMELKGIMDKYKANILLRTKPLEKNPHFIEIARVNGEKKEAIVYRNIHITHDKSKQDSTDAMENKHGKN